MLYGQIAGMSVSRILLGVAKVPDGDTNAWLSSILSLGVNFFDTARVYSGSEEALGRWFSECGTRDQVVLLTKCCHPFWKFSRVNTRAIRHDLKKSLQALQADYIDLYMLHRDDQRVSPIPIIEAMNSLKAEGKIHAFGASNWTYERIEEANEYAYKHGLTPFTASSPNFSLANQVKDPWGGTVSISGNEKAVEWYTRTQFPVLAFSSLARGLFSGRVSGSDPITAQQNLDKYARKGYVSPENMERLRRCEVLAEEKGVSVSQIALAWIFHQNMNMFAIVSTSSAKRMQQNIDALAIKLSDEECRWLAATTQR